MKGVCAATQVAMVAFGLCACDRTPPPMLRIVCLGDGVTQGVLAVPDATGNTPRDPGGGFAGRLEPLLVNTEVMNRGLSGIDAAAWSAPLSSPVGQAIWATTATTGWNRFTPGPPPLGAVTVATAVVTAARPDLVIMVPDSDTAPAAPPDATTPPSIAALRALVESLRPLAPTVLVSTMLPNRRDPPATIAAINAAIRAEFPDHLPLGERFAGAGGEGLLADATRPGPAGHALLAAFIVDELARRGMLSHRPTAAAVGTER